MSLILVVSTLLRIAAMAWSIILLRRTRDWRMVFLTVFLAFMATRPVLKLLKGGISSPILITADWTELMGS